MHRLVDNGPRLFTFLPPVQKGYVELTVFGEESTFHDPYVKGKGPFRRD